MGRLWRGAVPGQLSLLKLLEELPPSGGRGSHEDVDAAEQPGPVGAGLGEWERQVLAFAVEHHLSGRYDQLVQQHLGCSATRYLQALAGMLDRPEVLAAEPDLISQLRALRDCRQRLRALGRGPQPDPTAPTGRSAPGHARGQVSR